VSGGALADTLTITLALADTYALFAGTIGDTRPRITGYPVQDNTAYQQQDHN